jgi:hypothetical protein
MCGFKSPGLGFFYIPDVDDASTQPIDRATSIVIIYLEGNPSTKDLEHEFTGYLGSGWRCIARPLNKNQYAMSLLNYQEVQKAFFCKKMGMWTCQAVINPSPSLLLLSEWNVKEGLDQSQKHPWR